jgi:hypothetical protein
MAISPRRYCDVDRLTASFPKAPFCAICRVLFEKVRKVLKILEAYEGRIDSM